MSTDPETICPVLAGHYDVINGNQDVVQSRMTVDPPQDSQCADFSFVSTPIHNRGQMRPAK